MIRVNYVGRRGNGMFQYAFGRILHELTGLRLEGINTNTDLESKYKIPVPYGSSIFDGQNEYVNANPVIDGTIKSPALIVDDEIVKQIGGMREIANTIIHTGCIVTGFFQFASLYTEWMPEIKEWFWTPPWEETLENEWVFHIRHEDYDAMHRIPMSYYQSVIDKYSIKRFSFIGKDISSDAMELMVSHGGQYVQTGSSINDFRFMKAHRNIVCANSSYAWWSAVLSDADVVVIPVPSQGYWSRGSDQKLYIPDGNMIEMEC
jgi:hypothetical protein